MNDIMSFINYYLNELQKDKNRYESFLSSVNQFNDSFSSYITNNLHNKSLKELNNQNYQYDVHNNIVYFQIFNLNKNIMIQPILHMNNENKYLIYNLNFKLNIQLDNFTYENFFYLTPFEYNDQFNIFSYILHIMSYYYDSQILSNFYQVIGYIDNIVKLQSNNFKENETEEENELTKEDINNKLMQKFINKYMAEVNEKYPDLVKVKMHNDLNIIYNNLNKFVAENIINKTFKYKNFVDTLEKYTTIFDSIHLDKQINFIAHYFPNFTIRPIIEFKFEKNIESRDDMITIELLKMEVSYFNKNKTNDVFNVLIPLIPYAKDDSFLNFIKLMLVLQCKDISLFDNPDNPSQRLEIIYMLPFLETFFDEWLRITKLMNNPSLKRNIESQFLSDNKDFDESELDAYLKKK